MSRKNTVTAAFTEGKSTDFKVTPLAKSGDTNMIYYSGFCSPNVLPSAKYEQGGISTGPYLMIGRKDSQDELRVCCSHISSAFL